MTVTDCHFKHFVEKLRIRVCARGFAATFRRRAPGGRLRRSSIGSGRGRAHGMVRGKRTVTVDDGLGRNFSIGDFYSYSIPKGSFME